MDNQKRKLKRIRPKLGDIFMIPLPNGRYAYGKVLRDASVGIYEPILDHPSDTPINSSFAFVVGLYSDILKSGIWPIVGHESFGSEEQEWPPPYYIKDTISGKFSIYNKGKIREATEEECEGLEKAAVWEAHHIIDRIMGDTKWHV